VRSLAALISGSCFFVACYAYTPLPAAQMPTAGTVRLTLTPSSYSQGFGRLGSQVAAVEGDVRAVDDSSVTISVTNVARATEDDEQFHGETVTIPKQNIAAFDRRHVDIARSLAVTGLIVGGAIWIAASLSGGAVNQVHQQGSSTGQ
jgi:hypothetical protein